MSNLTTFTSLRGATRAFLLAGALAALFSPGAQAAAPGAVGLTRAEVIADTNLWIRAGVDKYVELVQYHGDTTQYDRAFAEYQRLRNGPAYAEELARVEAQRGETPVTRLSRQSTGQ